jgi:nitrogen regulatory protein PII-like uncharacterized protein
LNKKVQKGLVAAVAATMGASVVAPTAFAASQTQNLSLAAEYQAAYDATVKALDTKTQKDLTAARVVVDALYERVKGTADERLATTLSTILDPVQHVKLVAFMDAMHKADASLKQADINAARALIIDMPEVWRNAYSDAMDTIQGTLIKNVVTATEKAKASILEADKVAAQALLDEVKTVTNNAGVEAWAKAFQATIDAIVTTPKVESVSALNLREVEVRFNKNVDEDVAEVLTNYTFKTGSGVSVVAAKADGKVVILTVAGASNQQTTELTVNGIKAEDGKDIEKVTKEVKFLDTVAPTVTGVTVTGPRTINVTLSEPIQTLATYPLTVKVDNGALAVVGTTLSASGKVVTVQLGTAPSVGSHEVTIEGGKDYAGFKVDKTTNNFEYTVDTVAPTATIKKVSAKQVVLEFSKEVVNVTNSNVKFYHTTSGVAAYEGIASVDGKEVTINFSNPLPEGQFKLFVDYVNDKGTVIEDKWSNKFAETTLIGSYVADVTAPVITKVEAKSNTEIFVTYSETVVGADDKANYTLKDAKGNTVSISSVVASDVAKNIYKITVPALNGGSYTLDVKDVKDASNNKMLAYSTAVAVKDLVPPTVDATAVRLSNTKVKVTFSEAMDKASIENKLNYTYNTQDLNSAVTVTAVDNNTAVILDFANVAGFTSFGSSDSLTVGRVLDVAGNPTASFGTIVTIPAANAYAQFNKAELVDKDTVKIYFKESIKAVKADDYRVTLNAKDYIGVSVVNDTVDGKTVLTVKFGNALDGTVIALPTSAAGVTLSTNGTVTSVNEFGSNVNLSAATVADKYAPEFISAVVSDIDTTNSNGTITAGTPNGRLDTVVVTFTENLYVPSVQESDFVVDGYTVLSANTVDNVVTLKIKEKDVTDITATPTITLVGQIEDTSRNVRLSLDKIDSTNSNAAAVSTVKAKIEALPATIALANKTAVQDARTAYNSLGSAEKALVNNYSKLQAAEAKIVELQATQDVATAKADIVAKSIAWNTDLATTLADANAALGTVTTLPQGVTAVAAEGTGANAGKVVITITSGTITDTIVIG